MYLAEKQREDFFFISIDRLNLSLNRFISTMTSTIYNLHSIPINKNQNIISDLDS